MKKTKLKIKAIEELEEIAIEVPVVDEPKRTHVFAAKVLRQAINPQWIYCVAIEQDLGCIHVAIPRRMTNKLVGKNIQVESITDITGTSYRYVQGQPH
tara:strand:+ start:466 stop:759 length:294 start_codon:yes stop_codon:yes gene_type:complete